MAPNGRFAGRNPIFGGNASAPKPTFAPRKPLPATGEAGNRVTGEKRAERVYKKCTFCPSRGHTTDACTYKDARDKRIPPGWQCFHCYAKGEHVGAVCPKKYPFATHLQALEICCKCREPGHFTSQCQSDYPVDEKRIPDVDVLLKKCLKPTYEEIEAGNLKLEIAKHVMLMDVDEDEAAYYGEMYADADEEEDSKNGVSGLTSNQ
jgi:hypothetical protein